MRKLVLALGVAAVFATPAFAGSSSQDRQLRGQVVAMRRQVAGLGAQIRALQAQVKALQKQVKNERSETQANYAGDACLSALVTDAFQGTWLVIDQMATAGQAKTYFNAQTPLDDKGACKAIGITRVLPAAGLVPTIAPYNSFIAWLVGG